MASKQKLDLMRLNQYAKELAKLPRDPARPRLGQLLRNLGVLKGPEFPSNLPIMASDLTHQLEDGTPVGLLIVDGKAITGIWADEKGGLHVAARAKPIRPVEPNATWRVGDATNDVEVIGEGREKGTARLADGREVPLAHLDLDYRAKEILSIAQERRRWYAVPKQGSRTSIEWVGGANVEGIVSEPTRGNHEEAVVTVVDDNGWHFQCKKIFRFHCWHPESPGPRIWLRVPIAIVLSVLLVFLVYRGGFSGANHLLSVVVAFLGGFGFRMLYEQEDGRFSFWDWIIILPVILLILYVMGNNQSPF